DNNKNLPATVSADFLRLTFSYTSIFRPRISLSIFSWLIITTIIFTTYIFSVGYNTKSLCGIRKASHVEGIVPNKS
ncbi:hypothetical protein OM308_24320, partial [Escherichia albertii]|nr:hypothetical protein [Escherichia albertii]